MKFLRNKSSKAGIGRRRLTAAPDQSGRPTSIFSYHGARSDAGLSTARHEPRLARSSAVGVRFWIRRFGLAVLLVTIVAALTNVLSLAPSAKVMLADNAGSPFAQDVAVYQAAADKLLRQSVWNRNKLTVDGGRISTEMMKRFPELTGVRVSLPVLAHNPVVYIQPAEPVLILNAGNGSFIVDTRGKALLPANSVPALSQLHLVTLTDQGGLKVALNSQALPAEDIAFISTVINQLAARKFSVASMTLPAAASELDVQLSGKPYYIKFNLENTDARQQTGTFIATVSQLQQQGITPAKYVDVRVDGRAYYQ